jgi:proteasome beta subunit
MHYLNTWGEQPLSVIPEEQATVQALRLLTSAAEFDSATGGVNRDAGLYPVIKFITASGVRTMPDAQLKPLFESKVSRHV